MVVVIVSSAWLAEREAQHLGIGDVGVRQPPLQLECRVGLPHTEGTVDPDQHALDTTWPGSGRSRTRVLPARATRACISYPLAYEMHARPARVAPDAPCGRSSCPARRLPAHCSRPRTRSPLARTADRARMRRPRAGAQPTRGKRSTRGRAGPPGPSRGSQGHSRGRVSRSPAHVPLSSAALIPALISSRWASMYSRTAASTTSRLAQPCRAAQSLSRVGPPFPVKERCSSPKSPTPSTSAATTSSSTTPPADPSALIHRL